ncbi:hypothetical protein PybrP1_001801 [[Pythium] brassicae (nom. inval.)]|nr:hypothetical protein PybrP1_001801 [[Pythium] brassicae (nom. inval.)]
MKTKSASQFSMTTLRLIEQTTVPIISRRVEDRVCTSARQKPGLNALDRGFFASLQSLQYPLLCFTHEQLMSDVTNARIKMESVTIDKVFLTLQAVMEQIMLARGWARTRPHLAKDARIAANTRLPRSLPFTLTAFGTVYRAVSQETVV